MDAYSKKQLDSNSDILPFLKSLAYFNDAETDPEPEISFKVNWKDVKDFFKKEIPIIVNRIIIQKN